MKGQLYAIVSCVLLVVLTTVVYQKLISTPSKDPDNKKSWHDSQPISWNATINWPKKKIITGASEKVKLFLNALNRGEFAEAYELQRVPRFRKNGRHEFMSKSGYGGINKIEINSINLVNESSGVSYVNANYNSYDSYNSNLHCIQQFKLTKVSNSDWEIIELTNISIKKL
jgi:hypothetical protein